MVAARTEVGDDPESRRQRGDSDRHVDEENPAPIDVGDDGAANGRSSYGGEPGHATPDSECRSAALRRKDRGEDRERLRGQERTADSLQNACGDQLGRVLRKATKRGSHREDEKADGEEVALPVKVPEPTRGDEQNRVDQDVGVEHPQDLIQRRVQSRAHGRNRDVHDRRVEQDHEKSRGQNEQHKPRVSACASHVSS